jgi:hypothetical protein
MSPWPSKPWDHDHCESCWAKFAEADLSADAHHEGYATADNYRWIREHCFEEVKEQFGWRLIEDQGETAG